MSLDYERDKIEDSNTAHSGPGLLQLALLTPQTGAGVAQH